MILTRYLGTFETIGTGPNRFRGTNNSGSLWLSVWNSGTGAAAASQVNIGNNSSELQAALTMHSTGFTTSGPSIADSLLVTSNGLGGMSFHAANGTIRFYNASGSLRAELDNTSMLLANNYGVRVKNSAGTPIDGIVITAANEMRIGSDNSSSMGNTVLKAGSAIVLQTNGAVRVNVNSGGTMYPEANGTQPLGGALNRWATIYGTSLDTGDIVFDNRFKLTEHDKVGIPVQGMALCNAAGEIVAFFDRNGTVYARRYAKLPELYSGPRRRA